MTNVRAGEESSLTSVDPPRPRRVPGGRDRCSDECRGTLAAVSSTGSTHRGRRSALARLLYALAAGCSNTVVATTNGDAGADVAADVAPETCATRVEMLLLWGTCVQPSWTLPQLVSVTVSDCAAPSDPISFSLDVNASLGPVSCSGTRREATRDWTFRCAHPPEAGRGLSDTCDGLAVQPSFPGAVRWDCDPARADCPDGHRCAVVAVRDDPGARASACIPVGTIPPGATCALRDGRLGADDCAEGQCAPDTLTCVRTCGRCPNGESCQNLTVAPGRGVCRRACETLSADCGGLSCTLGYHFGLTDLRGGASTPFLACGRVGVGPDGAVCKGSGDCATSLACVPAVEARGERQCRQLCTARHPCPEGRRCRAFKRVAGTGQIILGACE